MGNLAERLRGNIRLPGQRQRDQEAEDLFLAYRDFIARNIPLIDDGLGIWRSDILVRPGQPENILYVIRIGDRRDMKLKILDIPPALPISKEKRVILHQWEESDDEVKTTITVRDGQWFPNGIRTLRRARRMLEELKESQPEKK